MPPLRCGVVGSCATSLVAGLPGLVLSWFSLAYGLIEAINVAYLTSQFWDIRVR
jgi:hypothetical protein